MNKATLETMLRNEVLEAISQLINEKFETDVLPVGAGDIAVPLCDAENNEKFILIKVSVPRGTRNGKGGYIPYDGYAANEEWKATCQDTKNKKDAAAKKAEAAERERERKRKAKAVVKELNKKGLNAMVHEGVA